MLLRINGETFRISFYTVTLSDTGLIKGVPVSIQGKRKSKWYGNKIIQTSINRVTVVTKESQRLYDYLVSQHLYPHKTEDNMITFNQPKDYLVT